MTQYKILLKDNSYNNWSVCDANTHVPVTIDIKPEKAKLFNGDVFTNDNNEITIIHSITRNNIQMPGILLLDNNIYGKYKNKYYYKCIPDDKHLPIFLIPYEEKNMGFSKKKINKYITFQYKCWDKTHPEGIIKNNIGNVDELNNFYEYQLFCKSLNSSIQGFGKDAKRSINKINTKETFETIVNNYNIEKRTDKFIFSIDGSQTQDFDDAFSIEELSEYTILSIYITNVPIWMDVLNLWDSFSQRISSIYLPDRKRPMLPTVLTNILCSLYKGQQRIALAMDIYIQNENIIDIKYNNISICVSENYSYDNINETNIHYKLLQKYTNILWKQYTFIKNIDTPQDIVAYLMLFMNYKSSKILINSNNGIFRSVSCSQHNIQKNIPKSLSKFIKIWNASAGQYTLHNATHEILNFETYTHITSPMRRLVDMLNLITIQEYLKLYDFSNNAKIFYKKWTDNIEYINITTRSIRKIQSDCNLLHWCNHQESLDMQTFNGYVFDKLSKNDGLFQYIVYLPKINMASKITVRYDLDNYSEHTFSLHIFEKKDSFKKKVRLHLQNC